MLTCRGITHLTYRLDLFSPFCLPFFSSLAKVFPTPLHIQDELYMSYISEKHCQHDSASEVSRALLEDKADVKYMLIDDLKKSPSPFIVELCQAAHVRSDWQGISRHISLY